MLWAQPVQMHAHSLSGQTSYQPGSSTVSNKCSNQGACLKKRIQCWKGNCDLATLAVNFTVSAASVAQWKHAPPTCFLSAKQMRTKAARIHKKHRNMRRRSVFWVTPTVGRWDGGHSERRKSFRRRSFSRVWEPFCQTGEGQTTVFGLADRFPEAPILTDGRKKGRIRHVFTKKNIYFSLRM